MEANNYDNSARFYDKLSWLIFGRALINAQVYLLKYVPANARILIVGGGTGWILEELTRIHPSGLQITYVEISANMMALSKKRNNGSNRVTFINDNILKVELPFDFDIVITAFLFDNFARPTFKRVFEYIHQLLKPGALWLNTDFQLTGKWWQPVLLKSMLLFFKVFSGIEAMQLLPIEEQFSKCNYTLVERQEFFGSFIMSSAYKKSSREGRTKSA